MTGFSILVWTLCGFKTFCTALSYKSIAALPLDMDVLLLSQCYKWVSWHLTTASCGCPASLLALNVGVLASCLWLWVSCYWLWLFYHCSPLVRQLCLAVQQLLVPMWGDCCLTVKKASEIDQIRIGFSWKIQCEYQHHLYFWNNL